VGLKPQAASVTLAPLALTATLVQPDRPDWVLNTQGEFSVAKKAARWELLGDLGGQSFRSDGQFAFGGERPRLDLRAQFTRLDLTPLTAQPAAAQASTGASPPTVSPPKAKTSADDVAVDLSGLQGLDARFNLQAGQLIYPPLNVGQAQLQGTLDKGLLRVTDFSGQVWEGRLRGQATADAERQRLTLQATGTNVDVGAMLQALTGKRPLEGRGRVTTDLRTEGATVGALRSALGGQTAIQIRDGAVRGINLAQLMRQARAAIGQQDEERPTDQSVQTDFTELSASFQIREGIAHNKDLDGRSPFLRVSGEGSIDLARESIDYMARATLTGTPEGQGGRDRARAVERAAGRHALPCALVGGGPSGGG